MGNNVGIAWSVGKHVDGDYPRSIPIERLVDAIRARKPDAHIFSIQAQGADEAKALGVQMTTFEDFADCAALVSLMDEIVSVDTAAIHVAGAIGHQHTTVLLSHWASWRWRDNPFYPGMRVCRQASPGDWSSALTLL
jgi:ADP-heptose:LPS heptosyltransferase